MNYLSHMEKQRKSQSGVQENRVDSNTSSSDLLILLNVFTIGTSKHFILFPQSFNQLNNAWALVRSSISNI